MPSPRVAIEPGIFPNMEIETASQATRIPPIPTDAGWWVLFEETGGDQHKGLRGGSR